MRRWVFLSQRQTTRSNQTPSTKLPQPKNNGPIHIFCKILREILASTAEAKLGTIFHNAKDTYPIRMALIEMGHPQPPTPNLIQVRPTTKTNKLLCES
mmetsp:Transcript_10590/g.16177  ORF Transcript_10590/g.16177 Transcript_10590/m.16177 type:complete len:98 (+) Transcript_10590:551-844(+)